MPGSKANTLGPDTSEGCLMLGAYGGYHWATQTVGATLGKGLKFNTRFKVQRWSTFGDRDGGWAAVSVSFLDAGGNDLGSTRFYLNPFSTFEDRPHVRWIKLGTGTPVPTGWVDVSADVDALAEELGIKPADVTSVTVGSHVFGTHEDRTHTVACFDDFSLSGEGGGAVPDSDLDGVPDVWDKCPDTPPGSCINRQGCTAYGAQTGAPPPPTTTYPPAPPAPPATAACTWDGKWNSNWGVLTLQSAGQGVTGGYEHDSGRINAAVSGNNITGTWSEAPSYAPPGDAGDLEFTMSADCRSFKGRWRYGSSGTWYTDWEGHRPTIGATGPLPGATGPLPRTTGPLPRTTGPLPRTTGPLPRTTDD